MNKINSTDLCFVSGGSQANTELSSHPGMHLFNPLTSIEQAFVRAQGEDSSDGAQPTSFFTFGGVMLAMTMGFKVAFS